MGNNEKGVISRSPVRVDLTGGYTDVAPFCLDYVGRSVNFAISLYTHIYGSIRHDKKIRIMSKDIGVTVEVDSIDKLIFDGNLDLVKSVILGFNPQFGMDLIIKSDAPPSSGLGTSGSLGVAMTGILNHFCESNLSKENIAELAAQAERRIGIAGGKQDQYAAALGGINYLEFQHTHSKVENIKIPQGFMELILKSMILAHPGGSRLSGDLVNQIMHAYGNGDKTTIYHLIALNEFALDIKDALTSCNFDMISRSLMKVRSHQLGLHPNISNIEIDKVYDRLLKFGYGKALGGAGAGSCMLWLCHEQCQDAFYEILMQHNYKIFPFTFDNLGLRIIEDANEFSD